MEEAGEAEEEEVVGVVEVVGVAEVVVEVLRGGPKSLPGLWYVRTAR